MTTKELAAVMCVGLLTLLAVYWIILHIFAFVHELCGCA